MSQNSHNVQNKTNENLKKKNKKIKKNIEFQEKKNNKLNENENENENKNENDNDNNNEYLSAHPIHILLQAVELAQKRGSYSINEALTISQAHKIISDDFYNN